MFKFGCLQRFVHILRQFHEGMMAHVTTGGQQSEPLRVCIAVRQESAVKAHIRMGLTVNISKTEVLCQGRSSPPSTNSTFTMENKPRAIAPSFKYLGSPISEDCGIEDEIQNRVKQASSSFSR
ncbi:hypothetical protein SKAU_G00197580 [Synaphobranchus kaupii]|uniref:Uncharacterized protein n=1 Tax=Synaphobranchus kaupii TaxID=118154 RepID=A0A9Q1IWZ4_SYNKA|nr:hypothetical protein SKAU_G00197580 [Synaphobranchus kaupii]